MRDVLWCVCVCACSECSCLFAFAFPWRAHIQKIWMDGRADGLDGWVEVAGFIVEKLLGFLHSLSAPVE